MSVCSIALAYLHLLPVVQTLTECCRLWVGRSVARSAMQANLSFLQAEEATALNCSKAWASLRQFESFYPNMLFGAELNEQYSNSRAQCLMLSKDAAEASGLNEGIALDAILLLDRLMHHSQEAFSEVHTLCHCLFLLLTFCLCGKCLSVLSRIAIWLTLLAKRLHPGNCWACSSSLLPWYQDGSWNAQACNGKGGGGGGGLSSRCPGRTPECMQQSSPITYIPPAFFIMIDLAFCQ